jgi:hypothetical protein
MGNLIGGLMIVVVLVCLLLGALAGAANPRRARRRLVNQPRMGHGLRPNLGRWQAPPPQPKAHPYDEGLKKNQGGWRWQ